MFEWLDNSEKFDKTKLKTKRMKSVLCLTKKTNGSPKDSCSHMSQTARWNFSLSIFSMDEQRLGDNFMQTTACVSIQTYFEHSSWAKENEQLINLDWVNKLKQKHTKSQQSETTYEKKNDELNLQTFSWNKQRSLVCSYFPHVFLRMFSTIYRF